MAITTTFAAARFTLSTVTVSAESVVDGSTPAARVTWRTSIPPQCIAFVTVEFRTSSFGPPVANYTTTNASQTEVITSRLQPDTVYYITVMVTASEFSGGTRPTLRSRQVQLLSGGKYLNTSEFNSDLNLLQAIVKIYTCISTRLCHHFLGFNVALQILQTIK